MADWYAWENKGTGNGQRATGNGLRRGADIAARLLALATSVLGIARRLPRDVSGRHVASRVIRSGTSAGATYEEGRAAESRPDFVHSPHRIAVKEPRETIFWLRLIQRSGLACAHHVERLEPLIAFASELIAILTVSARTARQRA